MGTGICPFCGKKVDKFIMFRGDVVGCRYCGIHTKQTNADRIRAMTDEELADSFASRCCPVKDEFYNCVEINKKEFSWEDCKSCWLDWLKSPVNLEVGK